VIIKTRSVRDLARECNIKEDILEDEGSFDALCEFVWRISKRERKFCATKLRGWYFNTDINKAHLLDLFKDEDDDYELM